MSRAWKPLHLHSMAVTHGVDAVLSLLVGRRFRAIGRTGTLVWLRFGDIRTVGPDPFLIEVFGPERAGWPQEVSEFALHTEAFCHLRSADGVSLSPEGDMDHTREGRPSSSAWRRPRATLFDAKAEVVSARLADRPCHVQTIEAQSGGGLSIVFEEGLVFTLPPDAADEEERWRLLGPGHDAEHLVMTGKGLEDTEE